MSCSDADVIRCRDHGYGKYHKCQGNDHYELRYDVVFCTWSCMMATCRRSFTGHNLLAIRHELIRNKFTNREFETQFSAVYGMKLWIYSGAGGDDLTNFGTVCCMTDSLQFQWIIGFLLAKKKKRRKWIIGFFWSLRFTVTNTLVG